MTSQPSLFAIDPPHFERGAVLSPCGVYRYVLWRVWGDGPRVNFVMLNPSTADATEDDPTVRRCVAFARAWGYGGLVVTNLYALRSTSPKALWKHADPVGPDNATHLQDEALNAARVVCAWGCHGRPVWNGKKWVRGRGPVVRHRLESCGVVPYALRLTADGEPSHPLYLPADLTPRTFDEAPRPDVMWLPDGFRPKEHGA